MRPAPSRDTCPVKAPRAPGLTLGLCVGSLCLPPEAARGLSHREQSCVPCSLQTSGGRSAPPPGGPGKCPCFKAVHLPEASRHHLHKEQPAQQGHLDRWSSQPARIRQAKPRLPRGPEPTLWAEIREVGSTVGRPLGPSSRCPGSFSRTQSPAPCPLDPATSFFPPSFIPQVSETGLGGGGAGTSQARHSPAQTQARASQLSIVTREADASSLWGHLCPEGQWQHPSL